MTKLSGSGGLQDHEIFRVSRRSHVSPGPHGLKPSFRLPLIKSPYRELFHTDNSSQIKQMIADSAFDKASLISSGFRRRGSSVNKVHVSPDCEVSP